MRLTLLALQLLTLAVTWIFVGGSTYSWFWPTTLLIVANCQIIAWAINTSATRAVELDPVIRKYLKVRSDREAISEAFGLARSRMANTAIGLTLAAFSLAVFVALDALPPNMTGLLLATIIGPCMFLAGEAFFQVVLLARLTWITCNGEAASYDRLRPSRTPTIRGLTALHGHATGCFFAITAVFVLAYTLASLFIIPASSHDSLAYGVSWLIVSAFVLSFPVLALMPRHWLTSCTGALNDLAVGAIAKRQESIRRDGDSGSALVADQAAESLIRAIEDDRKASITMLGAALAIASEVVSISGLLAAVPDAIRRLT